MQDQQPRRSIPLAVVAGVSALAIGVGSAIAWWITHQPNNIDLKATQQAQQGQPNEDRPPALPATPDASKASPANPASAPADHAPQVYWLKPVGDRLQLVPTPIQGTVPSNLEIRMQAALNQLLAGPVNPDTSTTIPAGTTLRSVTMKPDGVHIDLSPEFKKGGGSASMIGRVAQVIYTATSSDPEAKVWLSIAGKPLETLGGEGLMLNYPITREQFQKDFPQQVVQ
ncbi:GerMN domain-containing protein [Leptodesmis sp.]|uniref:GerMN domain-containing protein n=1 Tax=Leptodesmis sp. TaxID=3100501 RepID=UPI004053573B